MTRAVCVSIDLKHQYCYCYTCIDTVPIIMHNSFRALYQIFMLTNQTCQEFLEDTSIASHLSFVFILNEQFYISSHVSCGN